MLAVILDVMLAVVLDVMLDVMLGMVAVVNTPAGRGKTVFPAFLLSCCSAVLPSCCSAVLLVLHGWAVSGLTFASCPQIVPNFFILFVSESCKSLILSNFQLCIYTYESRI